MVRKDLRLSQGLLVMYSFYSGSKWSTLNFKSDLCLASGTEDFVTLCWERMLWKAPSSAMTVGWIGFICDHNRDFVRRIRGKSNKTTLDTKTTRQGWWWDVQQSPNNNQKSQIYRLWTLAEPSRMKQRLAGMSVDVLLRIVTIAPRCPLCSVGAVTQRY